MKTWIKENLFDLKNGKSRFKVFKSVDKLVSFIKSCPQCKEAENLLRKIEELRKLFPSEGRKEIIYRILNDYYNAAACKECGKPVKFGNFETGFRLFCSRKCMDKSPIIQQKKKETFLKRFGVENPFQSEKVKEKIRKTCKERYGIEHIGQSDEAKEKEKVTCNTNGKKNVIAEKISAAYRNKTEEEKQVIKEKRRQTNLELFGVENPNKLKSVRDKIKHTNLEKYGVENYSQTNEWKEKTKQTSLKKFGVENYSQTEECREKVKQTCLELYGVDNSLKSKECREKAKKTCLKKYGTEFASQSEEIKAKTAKTCQEKYGVDNPSQSLEVKVRKKKTFQERYGVDSAFQIPEVKEKILRTNLEKYGVENPFQSEEIKTRIKETCKERYGVEYVAQAKETKEKIKETCLEHFGVENSFQSPEIREKFRNTCQEKYGVDNPNKLQNVRDKIKETCKEKYGVEYALQSEIFQQKMYETKKKNGTFTTSKPEDEIYQMLTEKFAEVKRQYKSEKYPFICDFYVSSLDLYIEYQGTWTHGNEPFDPNNLEHQRIIVEWKEKAEEINWKGEKKEQYLRAIEGWTISDVKKRNLAKENKLNWVEFFTMEQFYQWFEKIQIN